MKTRIENWSICALLVCLVALRAAPTIVAAQAGDPDGLCQPGGHFVGFFNGVFKTACQAQRLREAVALVHGETYSDGKPIVYEVLYNETGIDRPGVTRFEDLAETFRQRAAEHDASLAQRWELFWQVVRGDIDSESWSSRIRQGNAAVAALFVALVDDAAAQGVAALTNLASNPPTLNDYQEQKARIDAHIAQREKTVLVAHSQGNLFMNVAYDYALSRVGEGSVKAVHVAPASAMRRGDYTLADNDVVVNLLRLSGSVLTANVAIPGPLAPRPPPVDRTGHGLLETYLNQGLATYPMVRTQLGNALMSVQTPAGTGQNGSFTITLTWNGTGDVDLHTFEPGGAHVFYSSKLGQSGALDVDNTSANGPEHFFATCDVARLQTGNYRVGINNYARAAGRTATVQVASFRGGVLATQSLDVGPVRGTAGNASPTFVLNVVVARDQSGEPTVSVTM